MAANEEQDSVLLYVNSYMCTYIYIYMPFTSWLIWQTQIWIATLLIVTPSSKNKTTQTNKQPFRVTKSDSVHEIIIYKTIIYYFSHFTRHQIVWLTIGFIMGCYCNKVHGTLRVRYWLRGASTDRDTGTSRGREHNLQLHTGVRLCERVDRVERTVRRWRRQLWGKISTVGGKIQTNKTHSAQL